MKKKSLSSDKTIVRAERHRPLNGSLGVVSSSPPRLVRHNGRRRHDSPYASAPKRGCEGRSLKYGATESLPTRVSGYAHRSPKKRGRQSGPERRDACFFTHLFYNRRRVCVCVCVHYPSRFSVYYYRFFERPTDKRTSLVNTFRKHSNSRDYARTIDGGQEPCPVSG